MSGLFRARRIVERVIGAVAGRALPCACLLLAMCRPTEISEARFQSRQQTCYPVPEQRDAGAINGYMARPALVEPDGCKKAPDDGSSASSSGSAAAALPAAGGSAASTMASSGSTSLAHTGAGSGADAGIATAGDAGPTVTDPSSMGGLSSAPPCDATAIFVKAGAMGGCTDTEIGGCHESGDTGVKPDLMAPGVAKRLLGGYSNLVATADAKGSDCAFTDPSERIWIKSGYDRTGSFVWNKVTSTEDDPPICGKPMPDDLPSLGDEDKRCIGDWIEWVAAGGGQ